MASSRSSSASARAGLMAANGSTCSNCNRGFLPCNPSPENQLSARPGVTSTKPVRCRRSPSILRLPEHLSCDVEGHRHLLSAKRLVMGARALCATLGAKNVGIGMPTPYPTIDGKTSKTWGIKVSCSSAMLQEALPIVLFLKP